MMMLRQIWLMTVVAMLLLASFLTHPQWCHCCPEEERIALLNIKAWMNPEPLSLELSDWTDSMDDSDCCKWGRIECDNTTNRVSKIQLHLVRYFSNYGDLNLNASLFLPFQDLKNLDLSLNHLVGSFKNQVLSSRMTKLEELHLGGNNFDDNILSSLCGFTSIKILHLGYNMLTGSTGIYGLKMLEELGLGGLNINGRSMLLESLGALPSLKILYLSDSHLNVTGIVPGLKILEVLYLRHVSNISGSRLVDSLGAFPSLKALYLGDNNWKGMVNGPGLHNLMKLEELNLDNSVELPTIFLEKIGSLSALKILSLVKCDLKGTLPTQGWCELKNLNELHLSENKLGGSLPACLGNMTSLRALDVSDNLFDGNIAFSPLGSLTLLEYLSIRNNHFKIPSSFKSFMNLTNLMSFSCGDNNIITEPIIPRNPIPKFQLRYFSDRTTFHKEIPLFLYTQYELRFVNLSQNNINGMFPFWMIENNTKLETFLLNDNSFAGSLRLHNRSSHNLQMIDISNNKIHGQILKDICSRLPNLVFLLMANNELSGGIPPCVGNMSSLSYLDLSSNLLTLGSIEQLISSSRLLFLKLSDNKLDGEIPPTVFNSSSSLQHLYLDGNNFKGQIWDFPFTTTSLSLLDISNNHLSGMLPNRMSNASGLNVINLSKNHFQGCIPIEFCKLYPLRFLDLSENDLSGSIPSCFNLPQITHIHLHKNRLNGQLSISFANCSSLVTLDLRDNNLIGPIPNWIGNLLMLKVLLLRANLFYGKFPVGLCSLENLSILDIAQNKLTGVLPSCLGNLTFNTIAGSKIFFSDFLNIDGGLRFSTEIVDEVIEFTTKRNSYNYSGNILDYMSGMDLSCNNFTGEIPLQMGYLIGIHALNLSHNNFYGTIPTTLSNLQQIESLDLSYNKLNGKIPSQLTRLTTLEVFNVSYNNLSGEAPEMKNQFGSFDEYSYKGNPFLCGPLLQNHCHEEESPPQPPIGGSKYEENNGFVDIDVFYVSFGVCYIIVVLTIMTVLYINSYWRRMWFYFIEVCLDTCYYFKMNCYNYVVDAFCKLTSFIRS